MKPWKTLATERSADGEDLVLQERDGTFVLRIGGRELMSSRRHGSEDAMADAARASLAGEQPAVLVGGLGLGYTLRAALDRLPEKARVVVVEMSAAVAAWNRGPLAHLAKDPLADPRVRVEVAELGRFLATSKQRFDAILTDVDNGPAAFSLSDNQALYGRAGLAAFAAALRPGGTLVIWSAGPAPGFVERLSRAGFDAREQRVAAHAGGGKAHHVLFVGRLRRGGPRR